MAQSGSTAGAPPLLARAHHGSVSKEQRADIEDDLKSGRLRCVVATSSLELGIDMGAVDLVIQVESPPSVASGLQRVGRAGHQVGEISKGVLFPKHRADLLHTTVATERMRLGLIEAIAVPQNPLDILAQQTVAAVALEPLEVEEWFETVRRSAPFATLPRSAYEATLDLLSGRYPSDEFAELRPRIVWDRVAGTIAGRPGAQRLAVTSGGTIPDRGMFGVFIVGTEDGPRRVGELDEEMVYESRVGDVFALGATSWRIEEITSDRVLVSPAFGQPGRVPFWKGDGLGRPAELGKAIGAFTQELVGAGSKDAKLSERLEAAGLDAWAVQNLINFVAEQKQATGTVPTDKTLLVERFRDELGDWRLVLHSPYGMPVHAPWALAVSARIRERLGVDGSALAGDDGIVVRLPETDADPPGADLFLFEPQELEELVTLEVGGSALFASRFRESAARALLLPRYNPGRRSPLWQQRQRSAQLLEVARKYPSFPIILETVREVLQDVYDLPALGELTTDIAARKVRLVEVETESPSPFARTLLFGYVAAFMYEGDSPLAERRAAALSLDPTLLAELLGRAELRELLDPEVIAQTERELQRTDPERRAKDAEGLVDLLRLLGPLSTEELVGAVARSRVGVEEVDSTDFARANRVLRATIGGVERWAVIEDASRLRDALGVPLPIGVPSRLPRPGHRPDRRPRQPLRAHAHPVRGRRRRRPARPRRRGGHGCAAPPRRGPSRRRGRVPSGCERHRVGRRRDPAPPARPLARRPALRGRAGSAARARSLPARLAARHRRRNRRPARNRRRGQRDRPARGGLAARIRLGEPRAALPRARLQPGDARRAHDDRRGALVGARRAARRRRLARAAPRRLRAAHPRRADAHRARDAARPHPRLPPRRRRVLLPAALTGARGRRPGRRQGARDRPLGAGLGRHRLGRHPRAAARRSSARRPPAPGRPRAAGPCARAPGSPPPSPRRRRRRSPAAGACCPPARRIRRPGRRRSPSNCSSGTAS